MTIEEYLIKLELDLLQAKLEREKAEKEKLLKIGTITGNFPVSI